MGPQPSDSPPDRSTDRPADDLLTLGRGLNQKHEQHIWVVCDGAADDSAEKKARCSGEARQPSPQPWAIGAFMATIFAEDKDLEAEQAVAEMKEYFGTAKLPDVQAILKFQSSVKLRQAKRDDDHLTGFIRPYMRPQGSLLDNVGVLGGIQEPCPP